jgi:hypothetical protein
MPTTHTPDAVARHAPRRGREIVAAVVAILAVALTALAAVTLIDFALSTYVDAEVLTAQVIIAVVATLALYAWSGAIALHRSASRELRPGPLRLTVSGLVAVPVLVVVALVLPIGAPSLTAYGLVIVAAIAAFVGALRM